MCHAYLYLCIMDSSPFVSYLPLISDQFDARAVVLLLLAGVSYTFSISHTNARTYLRAQSNDERAHFLLYLPKMPLSTYGSALFNLILKLFP